MDFAQIYIYIYIYIYINLSKLDRETDRETETERERQRRKRQSRHTQRESRQSLLQMHLYVFKQLLCLELELGLHLCNKRTTKIMCFEIILFGSLRNLTKFEYLQHPLCEFDEVMSQS